MQHHRKLVNAMHKNAWSKEEIAESVEKLHKFRTQESKSLMISKYWINIVLIFLSVVFSISILVPIIFVTDKLTALTITIFFGLIMGLTLTNSILSLEDFNNKHKLMSDVILFIVILILSFITLKLIFNYINFNKTPIYYCVSFAISFAIPTLISKLHYIHETKKLQKNKT